MEDEHMFQISEKMTENSNKKLIGSSVLDLFQKLTCDKEKVRISAGTSLIKYLYSIEDCEKKQTEFKYALNRLVRGVGASNKNSVTSFYSALVVLLAKSSIIKIDDVFVAIRKHLSISAGISKSETACICLGQILVCGALIHSEMFENSSVDEQKKIIQILVEACSKRNYLSLASFMFLTEILDKFQQEQFKEIWDIIKPEIFKPWSEQTLDSIYFILKVKEKFPDLVKQKHFHKVFNVPDIIHEDSVKLLCNLIFDGLAITAIKHPVYQIVAKLIIEYSLVEQFCFQMDNLLQKFNRNNQIIATNLLTLMLDNIKESSNIPKLITNNFIKHTLTLFKIIRSRGDDEFVNRMDLFFDSLLKKIQEEHVTTQTKIEVIRSLLFYPGTFTFEKLTKSKLIQQITLSLSAEGVKQLTELYKAIVLASTQKKISETQKDDWLKTERIYAAQLIVKLLIHSSVQNDFEWRLNQLKFFVSHALFNGSISTEIATTLKDCFYHALDQKFSKLENLRNILSSLIHFINEIFVNKKMFRNPLNEEMTQVWNDTMKFVIKLEGIIKKKHSFAIPVFHTLVLHMGLQIFNDFELANNTLKELQSCYDRFKSEKNFKKRKMKEGDMEEEEPIWIEVVIDLFLSLLSRNSHLIRSLVRCVFPYLCPYLTLTALRQILDVLDPKNETNLLLDIESEESSDEDEDDEENDKESDSDIEESENEEESATDRMRLAVRQALHKSGYQTDDESEDMDEMDEEEGRKLDQALSEAFRMVKKTSKGRKNKQSKEEEALTHFRIRVLDLIEIYVNSDPSMISCLEIACLLLQTLEFSIRDAHQKPLEQRLRSCLKTLCSIKKFTIVKDVTEDVLVTMLKSFLDKGSKGALIYQDMGNVIAECCVFALRCAQILNIDKKSQITEIFKESLETLFTKRDCLLPFTLYKKILQSSWEGNWDLISIIIQFAFDETIRPFRRNHALMFLKVFYSNNRFRTANLESFKSNIAPLEKLMSNKIIHCFKNICSNSETAKLYKKSVLQILHLLLNIKTVNGSDQINWKSIILLLKQFPVNILVKKETKLVYNKLCRTLGFTAANIQSKSFQNGQENEDQMEIETTSITGDENRLEKKRKKSKSHNKEKHKAKKEAQLLRMKAVSEGLTDLSFSNISLIESKDEDALEEPKPKKKHLNSSTDAIFEDSKTYRLNGHVKNHYNSKSEKGQKRKKIN